MSTSCYKCYGEGCSQCFGAGLEPITSRSYDPDWFWPTHLPPHLRHPLATTPPLEPRCVRYLNQVRTGCPTCEGQGRVYTLAGPESHWEQCPSCKAPG